MRNKAKPYLLVALPAVPYLVGVGLQVSGVTNIPLSVAIFEFAAVLAAAVAWGWWSDWRATAFAYPSGFLAPIRRWGGLKLPKIGTIRTEILAAVAVLLISNAAIVSFIGLAETRQETVRSESAYAPQLKRFYAELGGLFWTPMSKDTTADAFDKWTMAVDSKEQEIMDWVTSNMGPQAMQRLADAHFQPVRRFTAAISDKHNQYLVAIWVMQGNLKSMIETRTWDPK